MASILHAPRRRPQLSLRVDDACLALAPPAMAVEGASCINTHLAWCGGSVQCCHLLLSSAESPLTACLAVLECQGAIQRQRQPHRTSRTPHAVAAIQFTADRLVQTRARQPGRPQQARHEERASKQASSAQRGSTTDSAEGKTNLQDSDSLTRLSPLLSPKTFPLRDSSPGIRPTSGVAPRRDTGGT